MAIADLVNGKIAEPLTARALADGRGVQPGDVLALAERHGAQHGRSQVHRPAGNLAAHGHGAREPGRGGAHRGDRLRRLVDPRLPGDLRVRHAAAARSLDGDPRPVLRGADDLARVHGARPDHARALHARPALRGDQGAGASALRAASPTSAYFGPEAEFYVFDHVAFDQQANTAFYEVDSEEGHWTSGQGFQRRGEGLAALGYTNRSQEGYFPAPPNDTLSDLRGDDGDRARGARHPHREPPPRGRRARPGRDRPPLPPAAGDGGRAAAPQVRRQEHRQAGRQGRDVPPQADLRGERLGHARPPVSVEGRRDLDALGRRLRPAVTAGSALRGRPARARARADGVLRAHRRTPTAGWSPATRLRCS